MANIPFTISDAQIARVQDAFSAKYGYTGQKPDGTAETKNQFVKRQIVEFVKRTVKEYEHEVSMRQAAEAAAQTPDVDVT